MATSFNGMMFWNKSLPVKNGDLSHGRIRKKITFNKQIQVGDW